MSLADAAPRRSYLMVLPGQLAPAASGGKLARAPAPLFASTASAPALTRGANQGSLMQLDTPNPVLYLDFPEARRGAVRCC